MLYWRTLETGREISRWSRWRWLNASYWRPLEINREFASHFEPSLWRRLAIWLLRHLLSGPQAAKSSSVQTDLPTQEVDRREFIQALMEVVQTAGASCRIVLTMRYDYYGLCQAFPLLWQRLEAKEVPSRYLLRRMDNSALREAILGPLRLTAYRDLKPKTKPRIMDLVKEAAVNVSE
jgi:hypothetical protein